MGFICFLIAALVLALAIQPWVLDEDLSAGKAGLVMLLWFGILVGTNWGLAVPRLITAGALWACSACYALVGGGILYFRHRRNPRQRRPMELSPMVFLILLVFGVCAIYVAVRGTLVTVQEFDSLTYHFPKAVEIMRARSIPAITSGDFRVTYFPWNYELLLADSLLLCPGDGLSFLLSILPTFGFCAYAFAILQRAWPGASRVDALLGVVFVGATPTLILQAGAYKNDVLFSFFLLATLYWGTCWCQSGKTRELVLAILGFALGFGTKATALFLVPVVALAVWKYRARFSIRSVGGPSSWLLAASALAALGYLAGVCWPIFNKIHGGHWLGDLAIVGGRSGYEANAVPTYTGIANLWKFPFLVIIKPFSSNPWGVWVFWEHRYWWWPSTHPIYSHFGWLCSVLLLGLPLGLYLHRRLPDEGAPFRRLFSAGALAFVVLTIPQRYRIDGMFCGMPRYLLCIPVLLGLWTLVPVLAWLRGKGRARTGAAISLGLVAYLAGQAYLYLKNDVTKPFSQVIAILEGATIGPASGVAYQVDRVAGPVDAIAFDSGFGGTVYPLYGVNLTRPVRFLRIGLGPTQIPPETKWVVIDRSWNVGWSHPGVTSTGDFMLPIRRAPTMEDMALFAQLAADPEFVLVYNDPATDQAAFLRRKYLNN